MDASHVIRLPEHVVLRSFDTETVVLNLDSGKYHSINPTGSRFLDALLQEGSFARALARLATEFGDQRPATLERDLREFCDDLAARGLIETAQP
jgi:hypothetical protein